jgi:two-component system, cell cycle sensor histidine kinase and response regulator CckA
MMLESVCAETATILVVDDEPSILGIIAVLLKANGYRVLTSHDPGHALRLCEQYPEPIHLMITDVLMPYMNGRQLASQALVHRRDMRVIFISADDNGILANGTGLSDGMAFVQKPFEPSALLQKVRKALGAIG